MQSLIHHSGTLSLILRFGICFMMDENRWNDLVRNFARRASCAITSWMWEHVINWEIHDSFSIWNVQDDSQSSFMCPLWLMHQLPVYNMYDHSARTHNIGSCIIYQACLNTMMVKPAISISHSADTTSLNDWALKGLSLSALSLDWNCSWRLWPCKLKSPHSAIRYRVLFDCCNHLIKTNAPFLSASSKVFLGLHLLKCMKTINILTSFWQVTSCSLMNKIYHSNQSWRYNVLHSWARRTEMV